MGPLLKIYREHTGKVSDKWLSNIRCYDRIFDQYRTKAVNLLEIGIQNGGSLEIWAKYFEQADLIVGCDINEDCNGLKFEDDKIKIVVGNINNDQTYQYLTAFEKKFDIIIDDGSHRSSDIIRTFAKYFPLLNDNGLYIVEDLHCSYWQEFEGGIEKPDSALSLFRRLTDFVNREYWITDQLGDNRLQYFEQKFDIKINTDDLEKIESLIFEDSICIIKKKSKSHNYENERLVVGNVAVVTKEPLSLNGTKAATNRTVASDLALKSKCREIKIAEFDDLERNYENVSLQKRQRDQDFHSLFEENAKLAEAYNRILGENTQVGQAYHSLIDENEKLGNAYNGLLSERANLEQAYKSLVDENEKLGNAYNGLLSERANLEQAYKSLVDEKLNLKKNLNFMNFFWNKIEIVRDKINMPALFEAIRSKKMDRMVRKKIKDSTLFDANWYKKTYPNRSYPKLDVLDHFIKYGSVEGFSPSIGFDTEYYLRNNPDVAESGMNPLYHYLEFGRAEGRQCLSSEVSIPQIVELNGQLKVRDEFKTVFVVSHDASRTGAPILAYNVAKNLSDRYNVIIITLKNGDLIDNFLEISSKLLIINQAGLSTSEFDSLLLSKASKLKIEFAIVNSVESWSVLSVFKTLKIPTVALIHEYTSITNPHNKTHKMLDVADTIVFSTQSTLDSAIDHTRIGYIPKVKILHQGRCEVPTSHIDDEYDADKAKIQQLIQEKWDRKQIFIIGAGYVDYRKGVDLFIDVARKAIELFPSFPFKFVWFGEGYDPSKNSYSLHIGDQIRRSGLQDRFVLHPHTNYLDLVLENSEIFLLTSRLDPFPNVVIDAMSRGIPVMCFKNASGISDLLQSLNLNDCVADYLETADMATKLVTLLNGNCSSIGERLKQYSIEKFVFKSYIHEIEHLAIETKLRINQEAQAAELISKSSKFLAEYAIEDCAADHDKFDVALEYLRKYSRAIYPRRPEPGFNQNTYCLYHQSDDLHLGDAYADFISRARPEGSWYNPVISADDEVPEQVVTKLKYALHIHAYYVDELSDVLVRMKANKIKPELFISVKSEQDRSQVLWMLERHELIGHVRTVPNRGRDLGPLLTEFGEELCRTFDVIGHVHTKKSPHANRQLVDRWKKLVLSNIIGDEVAPRMMDRQLIKFEENSNLGLCFPSDPNVLSWDLNKACASRLLARMGYSDLPDCFDFPVGSMFWVRSEILKKFVELSLKWDDYPFEPVPIDGTILHALERLIGVVPRYAGYETYVTHVHGITR